MEGIVSATDANGRFSELLRGARKGRGYVITLHGQPVAQLIPAETNERHAGVARAALLARLKLQPAVKGARTRRYWTRYELYDERQVGRHQG